MREQEKQPKQPHSEDQTAKLEHSKERVRAKIETLEKSSEPSTASPSLIWFRRTALAILAFIAVWKTTVFLGVHTWLGGSLIAALIALFPTVFQFQTYSRLQSYNPIAGRFLIFVSCVVAVILLDLIVELLKIPQ